MFRNWTLKKTVNLYENIFSTWFFQLKNQINENREGKHVNRNKKNLYQNFRIYKVKMLSLQDKETLARREGWGGDLNYLKKNLQSLSFSSCTNQRNSSCCSLLAKIYCTQRQGFESVALNFLLLLFLLHKIGNNS